MAVLVLYVPGLNEGIGGRPLMPLHLFVPAFPFCSIFLVVDEGRKMANQVYREKYGRKSALERVAQY